MKAKHVILIELENSHDECLYSQVLFLEQSQHKVSMILSPHAFKSTKEFHYLCEHVVELPLKHGFFNHWRLTHKIMRLRRKWKARVMVFNTAQGSFVRDFSLLTMWRRIKVIGVLHTLKKLQGSFTQRLISLKIRKYYLLSFILSNQLSRSQLKKVQVFYPIFFHHPILPQPFPKEIFNIVIPGGVESRRKDLQGFMEQIFSSHLPAHWNIIFAGMTDTKNKDFKQLQNKVKENKAERQFTFYDRFIPTKYYYEVIEQSHVILPLIHPQTPSNEEYLIRQISGAFNLSYGFKIPMLMHEAFDHHEEFQESSCFYEEHNLMEQLHKLDQNRDLLKQRRKAIQKYPIFDFEIQQNNYLRWIE